MTSDEVIEPCPFCGTSDAFVERADYSSCYVVCNDCGARGPVTCNETDEDCAAEDAGMEPGENAARRQWNTRTLAKSRPVEGDVVERAKEILNRHLEYADGLNRGQYNMKVSNALAAVQEALTIAALPPAGVGEWQPIESAPKDGRWILVWLSTGVADTIQWAYGGWWNGGSGHVKEERVQLLAWQPLPAPPAPTTEQGSTEPTNGER